MRRLLFDIHCCNFHLNTFDLNSKHLIFFCKKLLIFLEGRKVNRTRRNFLPHLHLGYNTHRPRAEVDDADSVVVVDDVVVVAEDNRMIASADSVVVVVEGGG